MVQFNKLRLTGFKSFVDQTELLIEPGMTGIVGPNGCGKSNLVEALRWVMGENSPKRMRGGEMEDVIFAGSASRPSRSVAEVAVALDNSGRKAPAQFNESDELEVARRIERGMGSNYSVNGRDVRARDVQLLFADAATGAHSTALVSQGRVGAIINAKPTDRRALLEEAAGITGLHSRRHEAELRLRAAEANLARLDDVIVTLESQLQALKKQARQAKRYRNIQDQLRRAEAVLMHLQWQEGRAREADARQALAAAEAAVGEAAGRAAAAATEEAETNGALPALRHDEAVAAAEVQRINVARAELDRDEARVAAARQDAGNRLDEVRADIGREEGRSADAAEAERRLQAEQQTLETEDAGAEGAIAGALAKVVAAEQTVGGSEHSLAEATTALADAEARQNALARRIEELSGRIDRLKTRRSELEDERARLAAEDSDREAREEAERQAATAEASLQAAQARGREAELARTAAALTEAEAREAMQKAAEAHGRARAEIDAITAIIAEGESDFWPPLIDSLTVEPGFEVALGAALGDDLAASIEAGAKIQWQHISDLAPPPPLPVGTIPLSRHVTGSERLQRRLDQIGVVDNEATCRALRNQLQQGQRLVTRDGAMWRWDGFTVTAGTPTPAAKRLQQRNRLTELRGKIEPLAAVKTDAEQNFAELRRTLLAAVAEDDGARQSVQASYEALSAVRATLARLQQAAAAVASRRAALDEAMASAAHDIAESEAALEAAHGERSALPDLSGARARVDALRNELAEHRSAMIAAQSVAAQIERDIALRRQRLATIAEERLSWVERAAAAVQQLAALGKRGESIEAEIARLDARPAEIAEERHRLLDLADAAEAKRREAADRLAAGETRLAEAEKALKAAEATHGTARENRVRAEAGVEQAVQGLSVVAERSQEKLECPPENALALAELDPGEDLPAREEIETRTQRLIRERENIGPVNLRAESEAAELDQQIMGLQSERGDLVTAISRLRQGIASLNREGRERLLAAFEIVNSHFGTLFARLFGGGEAHLSLTEADDPLEAGLEIMARPPGKRLQVMSLLSGGEQAMTALSLLFAVFLTNPAPICVLDEVDAPLDDANVDRFCTLVEELAHSTATRFMIITHHRMTMARMDRLYGVTMSERGVSQLVSVDLGEAERLRDAG
ncbi:MAG: chromosome segregation protein SMC [Dongiaceae bacterium]